MYILTEVIFLFRRVYYRGFEILCVQLLVRPGSIDMRSDHALSPNGLCARAHWWPREFLLSRAVGLEQSRLVAHG